MAIAGATAIISISITLKTICAGIIEAPFDGTDCVWPMFCVILYNRLAATNCRSSEYCCHIYSLIFFSHCRALTTNKEKYTTENENLHEFRHMKLISIHYIRSTASNNIPFIQCGIWWKWLTITNHRCAFFTATIKHCCLS